MDLKFNIADKHVHHLVYLTFGDVFETYLFAYIEMYTFWPIQPLPEESSRESTLLCLHLSSRLSLLQGTELLKVQ